MISSTDGKIIELIDELNECEFKKERIIDQLDNNYQN